MGEEDVDPRGAGVEDRVEAGDPRTGVEYQCGTVVGHHLHARRVTTVSHRLGPGPTDRAPGAPKGDLHRRPTE